MDDETMLRLWYQALECEIGLAIPVDDVRWWARNMHRVRQEARDPELDRLILVSPPQIEELWLCKKQTNL